MKSAERPLREPGRLRTVCAPGTHPGVRNAPILNSSSIPDSRSWGAERILTRAAKSILMNGSVNYKETRQCR